MVNYGPKSLIPMIFDSALHRFQRLTFKSLLLLALGVAGTVAQAQTAISPSQTGSFFSDLRQRSLQLRNGSSTTPNYEPSTEGVYDYTRGEYTGTATDRGLGEETSAEDEVTRALGQPNYRNSFVGYSRRTAGDYTQAGSPYPATNTYFAPTYVNDPFLEGRRNLSIGPVSVALGLNTSMEYNDNISRSHTDRLDDFIGSAYLSVDAVYKISQYNQLSINTVIGLDHYFNHPELAPNGKQVVVNVLPGSTMALDMKIGDVIVTFYDRISVRPATQDSFALDNLQLFGVFQNDAGVGVNWAVNSKLNLSLYYNRSDSRALQDDYDIYDRSIDSVGGSLAWTPTGTWTVGIETSFSWIHYLQDFNNDGTTFNIGAFAVVPITHGTVLKVAAGYQDFNFNAPPAIKQTVTTSDVTSIQGQITNITQQIANTANIADPLQQQAQQQVLAAQLDQLNTQLAQAQVQLNKQNAFISQHNLDTNSHLGDYYYNVTLSNQLNSRVNQYIAFGHESALNTDTNFITSDYVTYGVGIILWHGARLTLSGYYEKSDDSGGRLAENIKQYGFDSYLSHQITPNMTAGIGYHYGNTDSNIAGRSYFQNALTFDLTYALTRKTTVGLGYRFLNTIADNPDLSFDQNRVIITANYNF